MKLNITCEYFAIFDVNNKYHLKKAVLNENTVGIFVDRIIKEKPIIRYLKFGNGKDVCDNLPIGINLKDKKIQINNILAKFENNEKHDINIEIIF